MLDGNIAVVSRTLAHRTQLVVFLSRSRSSAHVLFKELEAGVEPVHVGAVRGIDQRPADAIEAQCGGSSVLVVDRVPGTFQCQAWAQHDFQALDADRLARRIVQQRKRAQGPHQQGRNLDHPVDIGRMGGRWRFEVAGCRQQPRRDGQHARREHERHQGLLLLALRWREGRRRKETVHQLVHRQHRATHADGIGLAFERMRHVPARQQRGVAGGVVDGAMPGQMVAQFVRRDKRHGAEVQQGAEHGLETRQRRGRQQALAGCRGKGSGKGVEDTRGIGLGRVVQQDHQPFGDDDPVALFIAPDRQRGGAIGLRDDAADAFRVVLEDDARLLDVPGQRHAGGAGEARFCRQQCSGLVMRQQLLVQRRIEPRQRGAFLEFVEQRLAHGDKKKKSML
jgi:hypothetical protein